MKKIVIVLLSIIGMSAKMNAQQPAVVLSDKSGWHKITETKVDHKTEKDEVIVIGADKFATLIVKVTEAPVDLLSIDIYFEDGTIQKAMINKSFMSPGQSDYIELKGGERELKKVVFYYKTMANPQDKKGHVEVWGMKKNVDKKNK